MQVLAKRGVKENGKDTPWSLPHLNPSEQKWARETSSTESPFFGYRHYHTVHSSLCSHRFRHSFSFLKTLQRSRAHTRDRSAYNFSAHCRISLPRWHQFSLYSSLSECPKRVCRQIFQQTNWNLWSMLHHRSGKH